MSKRPPFQHKRPVALRSLVFVGSIVLNLLALVTPLAILMIFERVVPHQSHETLNALVLMLAGVVILEFVLRRARGALLIFEAGRNAALDQSEFTKVVLQADTEHFSRDDPEVHLERQAAIEGLRAHEAGEGRTLAIDVPFALVFVAMIGLIGGWLIAVPIACLILIVGFAFVIKRAQRETFEKRASLDRRRYAFLSEAFARMQEVKANTMEPQMTRRFEMLQRKAATSNHRMIRFVGIAQAFGTAIGQISIAATGLYGAHLVMTNAIGLAELAACMLLNGRVIQPSSRLLTMWVQGEAAAASRRKLAAIAALPSNFRKGAGEPMKGTLTFDKVQLADPVSGLASTGAFSDRISEGQILLVDADAPEYVPYLYSAILGDARRLASGRIYVDGRLPADWMSKRGAGGILSLERSSALFTGTLMENLSAFGSGEQVEYARALSVELGLDHRVRRLPEGYDTPLNAGGFFEKDPANRQLISVIRALALRPKVLLMIEPSAVLDVEDRAAVKSCLARLSRRPTILLASPDPRLRHLADKTFRLESNLQRDLRAWADDTEREGRMQPLRFGVA